MKISATRRVVRRTFSLTRKLDAADAALGHFHVFALVFEEVPVRGDGAEDAVAHQDGGSAVKKQDALQAQRFVRGEIGDGGADGFLQAGGAGLQQAAQRLALLAAVRFAGGPSDLGVEDRRFRADRPSRLRAAFLADEAPQGRPHVGRFLPAAQFFAVLPRHVKYVVGALAEEIANALGDHLPAIHAEPSNGVRGRGAPPPARRRRDR
jgi:hypothetical protein